MWRLASIMNIHSTTNNSPPTEVPLEPCSDLAMALNEKTIYQLANELFSLWPKSESTQDSPHQLLVTAENSLHAITATPSQQMLSSTYDDVIQATNAQPQSDFPERQFIPEIPNRSQIKSLDESQAIHLTNEQFRQNSPEESVNQYNATTSSFYFLNSDSKPIQDAVSLTTSVQDEYFSVPSVDYKNLFTISETANLSQQHGQTNNFYFTTLEAKAPLKTSEPITQIQDNFAITKFKSHAIQQLDVEAIRRDFPILQQQINGYPLVWFDNAATTQKPNCVIERISDFYRCENSNIHRAAHTLAARSTDAFEQARQIVANFIGAESSDEIIFVRGATEGINLVAKTWGMQNILAGDEILISQLEHHANIVPWYQLCQQTGAKIRVIPVDETGQIMLHQLPELINKRTKLVAISQVSNALGTITPVTEVIEIAHNKGAKVLIDAAQSISHLANNVQLLDADFLVFSGHKVYAPTGIGVLYAKAELLHNMPVWQGGGNMIQDVSFDYISYQDAPNKFEAGTANIADAVGLGAALNYIQSIGIDNIAHYEQQLLEYGQYRLLSVPKLKLIGTANHKTSIMSFILDGHRTETVGQFFNQHGIAVRSGHHCAQPILRRFGLESTVRPSLAFYNTMTEIDHMVDVLQQLQRYKTNI